MFPHWPDLLPELKDLIRRECDWTIVHLGATCRTEHVACAPIVAALEWPMAVKRRCAELNHLLKTNPFNDELCQRNRRAWKNTINAAYHMMCYFSICPITFFSDGIFGWANDSIAIRARYNVKEVAWGPIRLVSQLHPGAQAMITPDTEEDLVTVLVEIATKPLTGRIWYNQY